MVFVSAKEPPMLKEHLYTRYPKVTARTVNLARLLEEDNDTTLSRPLSKYERRHGLTKDMRLIGGARRTRAHRWAIAIATQEVQ